MRKGIVLAGGTGSRLYPLTYPVSKQLLPVYDKPMVYYGLSTLMLAGIKDILLISSTKDIGHFQNLFEDGSELGLKISYATQTEPRGIAEAFIIGEDFMAEDPVTLILGDNLLFGDGLAKRLQSAAQFDGAVIFSYRVKNPGEYGVVEIDDTGKALSIEEKPTKPKSSLAATGLYFYPNDVIDIAKSLSPSARGELEITKINQIYLQRGQLDVQQLSRGYAWLDAGTESDLLEAANFIATIERRQGVRIGCIEEVAWRMGLISAEQLTLLGRKLENSAYGQYILSLSE
ncbi:MAG: glucose-1-phosphate thymidylyltransferase RfbA [Rhodospirillales bacterium]|nr:glucose-1-phosphate thymidylyltransferase RfbA [Rhodospirillales bacterium]